MEDISIYEDVYEQLCEMIDPHICWQPTGLSSCGEGSLTASVVGSVNYLLEFWILNRAKDGIEHP